MKGNLAVPAYTPAPINVRWCWYVGPPALITVLYRTMSPGFRAHWNPARTPNSHGALAAILSNEPTNGWRAFWRYAKPNMKDGIPFWLDG